MTHNTIKVIVYYNVTQAIVIKVICEAFTVGQLVLRYTTEIEWYQVLIITMMYNYWCFSNKEETLFCVLYTY